MASQSSRCILDDIDDFGQVTEELKQSLEKMIWLYNRTRYRKSYFAKDSSEDDASLDSGSMLFSMQQCLSDCEVKKSVVIDLLVSLQSKFQGMIKKQKPLVYSKKCLLSLRYSATPIDVSSFPRDVLRFTK